MTTITTEFISSNRDDILIYSIGRTTQERNPNYRNGLSNTRLIKSLAAVLRHWEYIRNELDECKSINYWGILHAPFRRGQVVYRPQNSSTNYVFNEFGVEFIEDIIDKSQILKSLGVRINSSDSFEGTRYGIYFPRADDVEYGSFQKQCGLETLDLQLLDGLSRFYSKIDSKIISTLATCPTLDDCYQAMISQVIVWIHDIDEIFRLLKPSSESYSVLSSVSRVNKLLLSAFNCGAEVGEKLNWYLTIPNTVHDIEKTRVNEQISNRIILPLVNSLGNGDTTPMLSQLKGIAKILTGFLGIIDLHIKRLNPAIALPTENSEIAHRYIDLIAETGVEKDLLESLYIQSGVKRTSMFPETIRNLELVYKRFILPYLSQNGLPAEYNKDTIFPS